MSAHPVSRAAPGKMKRSQARPKEDLLLTMGSHNVTQTGDAMSALGSNASVRPDYGDFRSTPVNGHSQDRRACLKGATFGTQPHAEMASLVATRCFPDFISICVPLAWLMTAPLFVQSSRGCSLVGSSVLTCASRCPLTDACQFDIPIFNGGTECNRAIVRTNIGISQHSRPSARFINPFRSPKSTSSTSDETPSFDLMA